MIAVVLVLAIPPVADAQTEGEKPLRGSRTGKWNLFISPYGWLAGTSGKVVTNGNVSEIDVPFEVFAENTRAGFQLYFEARRNKLLLAFDGTWATLGATIDRPMSELDFEVRQRIYGIRVGYEVHGQEIGDVIRRKKFDWQRRGVVDIFAGGRYFRTEPIVTFTPEIGDSKKTSTVDSRIDPFVGLRIGWDMSYRWVIVFEGDIGGFGIGDAAQLSWQAEGQLGYRISRSVAIFGGYRWMSFDTITGEGEDRNGQDLLQQGPVIGAGIKL
jgi:hypothetical protein